MAGWSKIMSALLCHLLASHESAKAIHSSILWVTNLTKYYLLSALLEQTYTHLHLEAKILHVQGKKI
ncbi:hypothetical protein XELAEV_18002695mg [Xenopus laevis]|nr:hypothetical protein XELAEV_18002695mg [Xenopus laevis]